MNSTLFGRGTKEEQRKRHPVAGITTDRLLQEREGEGNEKETESSHAHRKQRPLLSDMLKARSALVISCNSSATEQEDKLYT